MNMADCTYQYYTGIQNVRKVEFVYWMYDRLYIELYVSQVSYLHLFSLRTIINGML